MSNGTTSSNNPCGCGISVTPPNGWCWSMMLEGPTDVGPTWCGSSWATTWTWVLGLLSGGWKLSLTLGVVRRKWE